MTRKAGRSSYSMLLATYQRPSDHLAASQLVGTLLSFVALWLAAWVALSINYGLTLLLAIPTGGVLVRLFVLQHDCAHRSLFRSEQLNRAVGRVLGLITWTPYDQWRRSHLVHHANSGNLDRRGIGDITTLTVEEYEHLSVLRRLAYRLYRNPFVMFGLGGAYVILLKQRFPYGPRRATSCWWMSSQATNVGIALLVGPLCWAIGVQSFVRVHAPVFLVYTAIGIWLFFIQHQFESTYWRSVPGWDSEEAAIRGSSYLVLPRLLQWWTASIGLHHIHHLDSRIPNYRLQECLRDHPELAASNRLTIAMALRATRLALWDEESQKLVTFADLRERRARGRERQFSPSLFGGIAALRQD